MSVARTCRWIGFRVDARPLGETVLTEHLAPRLEALRRAGMLARWFYLWYSETGFHLRLRLQPARGQDGERVADEVARLAAETAAGFRMQRQVYDREELAFGETRESVLAELLHVSTSRLALQLLCQASGGPNDARRFLLTSAAAAALARRAVPAACLDAALADWIGFAARAASRMGLDVEGPGSALSSTARLAALRTVSSRVEAAFATQSTARRTAALLRRTRERGERGRFVATHALHLFCNEMGLGFDRERDVALWVRTICRPENNETRERPTPRTIESRR